MPSNTIGVPDVATTVAPIATPTPDGTNSYCGEYFKVGSGDDCATIATEFGIERDDFLFLNPEVWKNCTNLWKDYNYCVKPVGTITTYSGHPKSTSTVPFVNTPATSVPYVDPLTRFNTSAPVIPLANDTRRDCYSYFYITNTTETPDLSCWNLAMAYDVEPEEIALWNPSLAENGTESGSSGSDLSPDCELSESVSYCALLASPTTQSGSAIQTPNPRAMGEVANCTTWFKMKTYSTCADVLVLYGLTLEEFYAFNPSVGKGCATMAAGTYYCISNKANGSRPGGYDNDDDDDDPTMTSSGTPTSTTTTPTTTSSGGIVTPTPTQNGMVGGCKAFYKAVANEGCAVICQAHGIELADFYKWNPDVGSDCTNLWPDYYVCVKA
ncbi:hypothetical protein VE01_00568 [Pseudogymnoascus verrucosus]|uniref:LysM domain-containing protein n=1 Tax=Pseudogymnoascus verrucosus TaxID=342668 RepID=A0A2P2SXJ8_9PEZI|nr:uncharacterized protein VE01_00568 [Pseudogymnoascus verrucosus]OBU01588.1 hypothetical protein VE01_00568 [Pseudogymnoascus verrucosus]